MGDTQNCSEDISREHYLSKPVRDLVCAKTVCVDFLWNDVARKTTVGIENLISPILCCRHNSALSPLDTVAIQAFSNFLDAMIYVTRKSLATKRALYAVSGEGLELWALKLLFGTYHATLSGEQWAVLKDTLSLDFSIFQSALEGRALAGPSGLYVKRAVRESPRVGCDSPTTEVGSRIAGLRFLVGPLECALIVDSAGLNFDVIGQQNYYRPSAIDLIGRSRDANILLSGPAFGANPSARLELRETRTETHPRLLTE
jgi:hypothetical protein